MTQPDLSYWFVSLTISFRLSHKRTIYKNNADQHFHNVLSTNPLASERNFEYLRVNPSSQDKSAWISQPHSNTCSLLSHCLYTCPSASEWFSIQLRFQGDSLSNHQSQKRNWNPLVSERNVMYPSVSECFMHSSFSEKFSGIKFHQLLGL
jgi:hypothetical protein